MISSKDEKNGTDFERLPIFKKWNRLYGLILLNQALLIILFYLFTIAFK